MGTFEQAHQRELLAAHQARLNVLELKKAQYGIDADPSVDTEISQITTAISRLRDALEQPIPEKTLRALSPDDRYQGHVAWQMRMEEAIYEFRRDMRTMRNQLYIFGAALLIVATVVALR